VEPQTGRDVLVAWQRRLKKSSVLEVWKLYHSLFEGALGRRRIVGFLRATLGLLKLDSIKLFSDCLLLYIGDTPLVSFFLNTIIDYLILIPKKETFGSQSLAKFGISFNEKMGSFG